MDAGNMLKPMLARGELHMIGATTLDEYRKHIEKDAALERRFQPVHGRRAVGRGRRLDPARPARAARGLPRREDPRQRAGRRGDAQPPLHLRPVPAGQGDRPGRRGLRDAAHRDRLDAGRARRAHPPGDAAGDRGGRAGQGERPGQQGPAGRPAQGAGRPARRGRRAARPVGGRAPGAAQGAGAARGDRAGPARGRAGRARLRPEPGGRAAPWASCPSSSGGSRPRRSSWPPGRAAPGCCARS